MDALAEFESGLVEWQAGVKSPEVELIASGTAAEALKEIVIQVDAEAPAAFAARLVNGTWSACLLAIASNVDPTDQVQYLTDRHEFSQCSEVDPVLRCR